MKPRQCSRTGCNAPAVATLTYAYSDRAAVVGPLALRAEPGCHDLCRTHSDGLSAPRGWELIRLPLTDGAPEHDHDDLLALADAVREVGMTWDEETRGAVPAPTLARRKRHLGVVADPADPGR
ncbi:MAG: DUF3499 domain-containing protein [Propioniciclava sp.]|uniref:DUF3499 domain-containing protein n=1 Tax=Propioniciclava sp. TaxID=2038686 RepID=UPI0039E60560